MSDFIIGMIAIAIILLWFMSVPFLIVNGVFNLDHGFGGGEHPYVGIVELVIGFIDMCAFLTMVGMAKKP
jgi:hypothetical protein